MKKNVTIIVMIITIIIIAITMKYLSYRADQKEIKKYNANYETYLNKIIYGTDVASIINNAVNNNEINAIEKNSDGKYIDDNLYCVKVKVIIKTYDENNNEEENVFDMETIYELGIDKFVRNYNLYEFKCNNIEYNKSGRVSNIEIKMI